MANKSKKGVPNWAIMTFGILIVAALFLGLVYNPLKQTAVDEKKTDETTGQELKAFSRWDVEFNGIDLSGGGQDSEDDMDVDIFVWDADKNSDLLDKNYVDCSGAKPALHSGSSNQITLAEENFCKLNVYKMWASWTAGDTETKFSEELSQAAKDLDDVDASAGTTSATLRANQVYLVTFAEVADGDEDDVIPMAFLMKSDGKTIFDPTEFENGNVNTRFNIKYYNDAAAASKVKIGGECTDSEDNNPTLTSALNGLVDSSLTSATTIDVDCDIEVEVTKDGYGLFLYNELAQSNAEQAYLSIEPYGVNSTNAWVEYGGQGLTGDIGFSATAANSSIVWQGMEACGEVITSDSSTDAVVMGNEKIYASSSNCLSDNVFDAGATVTIPIHIDSVKVDYDAAVDADDAQIDCASGSSPEPFADINLVGLESSSDMIGQTLDC